MHAGQSDPAQMRKGSSKQVPWLDPLAGQAPASTAPKVGRLVSYYFFSGLPGIWDFTFLTKNGTLPSFIGSVESSPLDHQGSLGAFI